MGEMRNIMGDVRKSMGKLAVKLSVKFVLLWVEVVL